MKLSQLKQIIKEEISKVLNEYEDLSTKNNYFDDSNEVDSREVAKDLLKIKPYFKSKLPLYQNNQPLTDYQINSLIDTFAANERDISASMPTGPGEIERIQGRWSSVDIDDLTNYFIDFVEDASEDWNDWEFHDAKKKNYSDFNWPTNTQNFQSF
jgi:hypothetical protein